MGTPEFSVDILQALYDAGHDIAAVYCQPPSRSGRGRKERPSPVHILAERLNIPVFTPRSLKSPEEQQKFKSLNLDLAVVVAYGLILPKEILDAPKYGCLNIHASLLPRWRGAAPIHRAIMAGDKVTAMGSMVGINRLLARYVRAPSAETARHDVVGEQGLKRFVERTPPASLLLVEPLQRLRHVLLAAGFHLAQSTCQLGGWRVLTPVPVDIQVELGVRGEPTEGLAHFGLQQVELGRALVGALLRCVAFESLTEDQTEAASLCTCCQGISRRHPEHYTP